MVAGHLLPQIQILFCREEDIHWCRPVGGFVPRSTPLHLRCGVGTTWEWTAWAVNGTDHFLQIMLIENIALAAFKSRVALRFLSCVLGPGRRQIILNAI